MNLSIPQLAELIAEKVGPVSTRKDRIQRIQELLEQHAGEYICPRCGIRQDGPQEPINF